MVMRPGQYQANFNAGELAPELWGGTGLKQFFSGAAAMQNVQPVPQGGFKLLPRSQLANDLGVPASAAGRLLPFSYSLDIVYDISLEPGQLRIFRDFTQVATVSVPYGAGDLQYVHVSQRFDTMILEHANYAPLRLLRGGSDTSWTIAAVPWANIPQVQYSGTYANVDEVWAYYVQWAGTGPAGLNVTASVAGDSTSIITMDATNSVTAGLIQSAILALSEIDAGLTVNVVGSNANAVTFYVHFTGGRNSGANFSFSGSSPNTTVAVETWRVTKGVLGGEDLMSTARGWPRCCCFFDDRLLSGGFAAKPAAWDASRTGEYFDLNDTLTSDTGGMLINFDADGAETILHMIEGVYLGFFTTNGMYHLSDRTLKVSAAPNIVKSPQAEGASARVSPVIQENAVLYVNRAETIIYAATYDAITTTFQTSPLSIMSSHLIEGIGDAALQKSHVSTDAQRYYMVRDDGLMPVACLIRNQDVQPFVRWVTDGEVRAVCVDGANAVTLLVDRLVGGVVHRFRERLVEGLLLDAALSFTYGSPTSVITGLGAHEGATVWAIVDGYVDGPFIVSGATITLTAAGINVTVGRWTPPIVDTLPLPRDVGNHTVLKRPARVHTVQVDLLNTTSLAIGANGQRPRDVTFARAGDPVDQPTPAYTGEKIVTGLTGFTKDGQVRLTQLRPGYLQVRDLTIQART